jgi:ElaB/YqjD/DUF883 family membrane-anchored ribosome-binding protein
MKNRSLPMDKTRIAGERVMSDLKTLVSDADSLLKATANDVSDTAKEARARLLAGLDRARATCESLQDQSIESGRHALRKTEASLRDHPYETLAVALGAGVLIGWILSRTER